VWRRKGDLGDSTEGGAAQLYRRLVGRCTLRQQPKDLDMQDVSACGCGRDLGQSGPDIPVLLPTFLRSPREQVVNVPFRFFFYPPLHHMNDGRLSPTRYGRT